MKIKDLKNLFEVQDKVTLKDLANTGLAFWRFSQSKPEEVWSHILNNIYTRCY